MCIPNFYKNFHAGLFETSYEPHLLVEHIVSFHDFNKDYWFLRGLDFITKLTSLKQFREMLFLGSLHNFFNDLHGFVRSLLNVTAFIADENHL